MYNVYATDFLEKNTYSIGINANVGGIMGGGVEFGFPIIKGDTLEWRNFISFNAYAVKLFNDKFDNTVPNLRKKMTLSYLTGSSVASRIGLFRPYLFVSDGFGLIGGSIGSFTDIPYY